MPRASARATRTHLGKDKGNSGRAQGDDNLRGRWPREREHCAADYGAGGRASTASRGAGDGRQACAGYCTDETADTRVELPPLGRAWQLSRRREGRMLIDSSLGVDCTPVDHRSTDRDVSAYWPIDLGQLIHNSYFHAMRAQNHLCIFSHYSSEYRSKID